MHVAMSRDTVHDAGGDVVKINDTTLRDGEQAPGVQFSEHSKIQIVERLLELGVNEIEAGVSATLHRETQYLMYLQNCDMRHRFGVWSRANLNDINQALNCKFGQIHISVPISDFQLHHMGLDRKWVLTTVERCIRHVYLYADTISIGAQDATRATKSFLLDFVALLNSYNVKRLRFSDTVGISVPSSIAKMTAFLRRCFNGDIDFHGHNDLGLATANCVAAVENGVTEVSTTVNGIGERAGNAALEQVAVAVEMGLGKKTGVNMSGIPALCELVANASDRNIPVDSPVTGENVFTHASGIHCHGQLKNDLMYQPFKAETVGRTSKMVLGKHSGSASVCAALSEKGINISRMTARTLLSTAHDRSLSINTQNILQLLDSSNN